MINTFTLDNPPLWLTPSLPQLIHTFSRRRTAPKLTKACKTKAYRAYINKPAFSTVRDSEANPNLPHATDEKGWGGVKFYLLFYDDDAKSDICIVIINNNNNNSSYIIMILLHGIIMMFTHARQWKG